MSKVFFDVGISFDGFVAGLNGGPKNPLGDGGIQIHHWMFKQKSFLKRLDLKGGGEENNADNELIEKIFNRPGAYILGKRMFEEGEANWPENAPFGKPVYVVTNETRDPWERKGGTTFYFVNDGIESAMQKAKQAAGDEDIRISGGANMIQQYLNAGYIDEFCVHIAPVLRTGVKLYDNLEKQKFSIHIKDVINSPMATHVFYEVINDKKK